MRVFYHRQCKLKLLTYQSKDRISIIMLSNMSSSILNSSPTRPGVGGESPEFEVAEDFFIEEVPDSGTLFAEILETASASSNQTDSIANMSDSDSDEDILNFLVAKDFIKGDARRPTTRSFSRRSSSQDTECSTSRGHKKKTMLKDIEQIKMNLKRRGVCMNKAAISARMQREKKKRYIDELEGRVDMLESENKHFTSQLMDRDNHICRLKNEVHYLKSVIANHTSLTSLLSHIPFSTGMQFGSSICSNIEKKSTSGHQTDINDNSKERRVRDYSEPNEVHISKSADDEEVYVVTRAPKKQAVEPLSLNQKEELLNVDSSQTTAGVCLHVSNNKVSLEFCATCASNAATALSGDHSYVKFSQA